jgi:hypothetical protein
MSSFTALVMREPGAVSERALKRGVSKNEVVGNCCDIVAILLHIKNLLRRTRWLALVLPKAHQGPESIVRSVHLERQASLSSERKEFTYKPQWLCWKLER